MHHFLSVCDLTKITLPKFIYHLQANGTHCWLVPVKLLEIFNYVGRWAHFNVKLHFLWYRAKHPQYEGIWSFICFPSVRGSPGIRTFLPFWVRRVSRQPLFIRGSHAPPQKKTTEMSVQGTVDLRCFIMYRLQIWVPRPREHQKLSHWFWLVHSLGGLVLMS